MRLLQYPYIIITILLTCFALLAIAGIYFLLKGFKTASGNVERDFTGIARLRSLFGAAAKQRTDRCLIYVSVSMEDYHHVSSGSRAGDVLDDIRSALLAGFSNHEGSAIARSGESGFVAFAPWNAEQTRNRVEWCREELGKCLLNRNALNLVDVRFGSCVVFGTQVAFEEAVNRAKQACMLAKRDNVGHVAWNAADGKALAKKIELENQIESEIDNNRFFLECQPVLDAKTKKVVGAEVLSRLNSEQGVLSPGSFLSAVSSVGLNEKFDYYIFEKTCKWISNDKGSREGYRYTINFSRSTLCEPHFAEKIIDIAERYQLKFSCLAVEILEDKNVTGAARQQMIHNLSVLRKRGFSILLDDFGSGFTAFSDLQQLDISVVKIDKSITQNATTETGFIILKNIIQTAKDIGFATLCEGVETEEQEQAVVRAGCDLLQGFYYYRPMPVAQLEKLFDTHAEC